MKPTVKRVTPQPFAPRARNKLLALFVAALVAVVIAQYWVHPHPYTALDGTFWFYPVYGLGASLALVLASNLLGIVLKRREHYWGNES